MFNILVLIIIILFLIHKFLYYDKKGLLINKIPGPKLKFIIGNTFEMVKPGAALFYTIRKLSNKYNGFYRIQLPFVNIVMTCDPKYVEPLLTSQKLITKERLYTNIQPWLGTGLLLSTGEKWFHRRKILTPAFHFNILQEFCKIFVEHSDKLVTKLMKMKSEQVAVTPLITDFTLNIICETAMGINLDETKNVEDYKIGLYELGEFLVYRAFRVWLQPSIIFNQTAIGKKQKKALSFLHDFTTKVIDERRRNRVKSFDYKLEDDSEELGMKKKKRMAMLDLLLTAESEGIIDPIGIREEVDTFMFEGHDTITTAMQYLLMSIANNPEIQELVYKEVEEVLRGEFSIENLNNLKYMERCIKESLRLYPSVPFLGREITEDTQIGDYLIPAGTIYDVHIFDLHRNPKIYPNPEKFDPDRFLPENCAKRHNFAYLPFSAGPRNCIGQRFAMLEMKTTLASILKRFKLEPVTRPEDIEFFVDIVLRSKNEIKVKFIARN